MTRQAKYTEWDFAERLWRCGTEPKRIEEATGIPRQSLYQRAAYYGWPRRGPRYKRLSETILARMKAIWEGGGSYAECRKVHPVSRGRWVRIAQKHGWTR